MAATDVPIESVLAHPVFARFYACAEHWAGRFKLLRDALGTDCVIQHFVDEEGRLWMRAHAGDGRRNEDWFGWGEDVLSPCDCRVIGVHENNTVNEPGVLGTPPASSVVLRRDDGVHVMLAHVAAVSVKEGDLLARGQVFAQVGNNGMSRHPHIHVGAWKDKQPLQIRFDQVAMRALAEREIARLR
ncbi:M23 family metallopeptidase [Caldimonas sp. KR1-144]|uniref:M23 family metallopeptidase n=1 Tax=Caldimonas sp. KR1-144 TaxID=3400911 RepID=UPI003C0D06DF